jgi:C4-type Zn-finger protein
MIKTDPSPAFDKKLKERIMFRAMRKCDVCGYTKDESVGFSYQTLYTGEQVWECTQCGSRKTHPVSKTERDIHQELYTVELNLDAIVSSLQSLIRSLEALSKELKSIRKEIANGHN